MHLHQNRELAFHHLNEGETAQEIFAARQAGRDDLSFIDGASAVLSLGGGKAYSVRSSKLSKFSVLTPPTNLSVASSAFLSRKNISQTYSTA
jgi:hypothetical protein